MLRGAGGIIFLSLWTVLFLYVIDGGRKGVKK